MNIMNILSLKNDLEKFKRNHPKFIQFVSLVTENGIQEETILECKMITPEGKEIQTNFKVTRDDLELLEKLKNLKDDLK